MTSLQRRRSPPVRIAYFISLHHKPYQFEWLLKAISSPDDLFLIHLDLKTLSGLKKDRRGVSTEVRRLTEGMANVRFLSPRYSNWGGWSLGRLALSAIDVLLHHDQDWTHFINLSGQCYPTKSAAHIRDQLATSGETQFVQMIPFADLPPTDWHLRRSFMVETPVRAFALPIRRSPPRSFDLNHKGAQWVMLTRAFCQWQQSCASRAAIMRHMAFTHLSDELIFQSLMWNGPYREQVANHYGRSIIWPGPKVLRSEDLPFLSMDAGIFGRKFDSAIDTAVLQALASSAGYQPGPSMR